LSQHNLETLQNHPNAKRRGELAELAFMYRATSEGISVAKPYGDSHPYDFIVQHGRLLSRVQVKSTFRRPSDTPECIRKKRGRFGYQVIVARLGSKEKSTIYYSRDDIDFVACFIAPVDVWYIIPVEKLGRRHAIRLFPQGKGQPFGGLYEEYLNTWNFLKEENSSTSRYTSCASERSPRHKDSSISR
jgi:hypothetical protein